jgi:hypothetical protein
VYPRWHFIGRVTGFYTQGDPQNMTRIERKSGIRYTGRKIRETEKAVLFEFHLENNNKRSCWVPLSQINMMDDTEIEISEWIAAKLDL